jgi:hypothetical protein
MKRLRILLVGLVLIGIVLSLWWRHSPYYHEVRSATTFTVINAPADRVAAVLTDFSKYPEWNPYVIRAEKLEGGTSGSSPLRMRVVESVGGHTSTHRVHVTRWEENGFSWSGSSWPGWLLSWNESFDIVRIDAGHSELQVTQSYQGVLLRSYWNYRNRKTLDSAKAMGASLKKRVEP